MYQGRRDVTIHLGPLGLYAVIDRPNGPRKRYRVTNARVSILNEMLFRIITSKAYDWEFDFGRSHFDITVYGV